MSTIPELKQKKIARDAEQAKAAAASAAQAVIDDAELTKVIYAKAQAYEKEYEEVTDFIVQYDHDHMMIVRRCRNFL